MALFRSLIVGVLAVAVARPLCGLLADPRSRVRRSVWALLLAPYLTPVLLTGYAYANFSLSLVHYPTVNAMFYAALLWWKFTPIAALVLHFAPSPISTEAIHCHRLLGVRPQMNRHRSGSRRGITPINARQPGAMASMFDDWIFLLRAGCARGPAAAFAVVFLYAFAEFEMASLMGVKSWTVTLFDAHAGGLALGESLRRILGPLVCEASAVAIAVTVLARHRATLAHSAASDATIRWIGWIHLVVAFLLVVMIPAMVVLWGTIHGFGAVFENFALSREIISSVLFAAAATLLAGVAAFWLGRRVRGHGLATILGRTTLILAALAGLLGPLVLSLAALASMQLPWLLFLRDTPVPLVVILGLVLLPVALMLRLVLDMTRRRSALHLATLLGESGSARELLWRLSTSKLFWTVVLLFVGAYWDLTASAILAPVGMTPVTVRLYNLMHYGQAAALSAMICAAFATPVLIFLLALGTRHWWGR